MSLAKKLATLGMIGAVGLANISNLKASFFKPVDLGQQNFITLEGRFYFSWEDPKGITRYRFSEMGDEIGIFRGPMCIGSSALIDEKQSHYTGLKIYSGARPFILNGTYDVFAYNKKTNTLWDVGLAGYGSTNMDFVANNDTGHLPEPATLSLLGLGALGYLYSKRKK